MRKIYLGLISLAMATLFLGCSDLFSTGEDAVVSNLSGAPVQITTTEAASNSLTSISSVSSSGTSGSSLKAAMSLKSLSPSLSPSAAPQTVQCPSGGSAIVDGSSEADRSVTYSNCGYSTTTINGSMRVAGETMTFSNLTMNDSSYGTSYTINMTMINKNLADKDMTMTGTISFKNRTASGSFGYQNFHSVKLSNGDVTLDGDISILSSEFPCNNGQFSITTPDSLTPESYGKGFSAGTMIINNARFVFNNDNTVTVRLSNGNTETISQGISETCSI